MNEIELQLADHILLFVLGIILPLLAISQTSSGLKGIKFDTAMKKQVYFGNSLFQWGWAIAVLLAWWYYQRSFSDLGFQLGVWNGLAIMLLFLFLVLYSIDTWWNLRNTQEIAATKAKWQEKIPILPANFNEYKSFLFVAITAGVCEEIVFRGFFIHYFSAINQDNQLGTWLAILIPAFLFAIGHIYQGEKAVLKTIIMATLFGWLFVLTKSLLLLMFIHFLVDAIGGYIAMRLLERDESEEV